MAKPGTSIAAINLSLSVDASDFRDMTEKLREIGKNFGPIFYAVKPEFGAYMVYSGVLEFGRRDARMMRFRIYGGGTVASSHGVPHIRPAVKTNAAHIIQTLTVFSSDIYQRLLAKGVNRYSIKAKKQMYIKELENVWTQLLMDRPRRYAVARAPYLYGFHRRSIQGRGTPITASEIAAMQAEAKAFIKRSSVKKKAKKSP